MKVLDLSGRILNEILRRCDLLFLTLFVIYIHLPYLSNLHVPRHDTMYSFNLFYYFYNNLFFHGEIAQWLFYDSLGLPSNHDQLFALSPINYLSFLVGWLFRVKNVMLLFKLSLLGEQLVLLLGMYLLSRCLFTRRSTVFVVCLGSICCADLLTQPHFDFRLFYMFPLAAYFFIMFFRKKKAEFLWLAGITIIAWEMGNVLYFIFLWGFIFTIMGFVLFLKDKSIWKCFLNSSRRNIILFGVFIIFLGMIFYHLHDITNFVNLTARGTDGKNNLSMWLHWGGTPGVGVLLKKLFLGETSTVYIGLLPLVFFVWALLKVRGTTFAAFLSVTVVLLGMSFGGIFAAICFYFPGLAYYRHIGLTHGFLKILILIGAGFGLEHFWQTRFKTKIFLIPIILAILVFLADSSRISGEWFESLAYTDAPLENFIKAITLDSIFARISIYLGALLLAVPFVVWQRTRERTRDIVKGLLILAFCVDIFSFQHFTYQKIATLPLEYRPSLYTLNVNQISFQTQRTQVPVTQRQRDSYNLMTRPGARSKYTAAYGFMQLDPCRAEFFTHMYPLGLKRLMETRREINQDLWKVMGCHSPKLRVMTNAVYTDTIEDTIQLMKRTPSLYNVLILRGVDKSARKDIVRSLPPNLNVSTDIKEFSPDKLLLDVDVPVEGGAWLVYADSFHPGWHASVNGKKTPIYEAYLAFKAVRLEEGRNTVRFVFHNGINTLISYAIGLFGIIVSGIFFIMFLRILFNSIVESRDAAY